MDPFIRNRFADIEKAVRKKYGEPNFTSPGNIIIPIKLDGSKAEVIDGYEKLASSLTSTSGTTPTVELSDVDYGKYFKEMYLGDWSDSIKRDQEKMLDEIREKTKQIDDEIAARKTMAFTTRVDPLMADSIMLRSIVPPEFIDYVIQCLTMRNEYDMSGLYYELQRSPGAKERIMSSLKEIMYNLELLAREFKANIDRAAFSNGYVMDDESKLPSELVNYKAVIRSVCEAIEVDSEVIHIDVLKPLEMRPMDYSDGMIADEEKLTIDIVTVPIGDHLYWVKRLADLMRQEVDTVLPRFEKMMTERWESQIAQSKKAQKRRPILDFGPGRPMETSPTPGRGRPPMDKIKTAAKVLQNAMTVTGMSMEEATKAITALGTIEAGIGIDKPEKYVSASSARSKRRNTRPSLKRKKPAPDTPKTRAIDI